MSRSELDIDKFAVQKCLTWIGRSGCRNEMLGADWVSFLVKSSIPELDFG